MGRTPRDQTSIKALFQSLVPDDCGIFQGEVVSTSPLKIQAVNDEKLILNALILIVPRHLTDYTITVDISVGDGKLSAQTDTSDEHSHKLASLSLSKGTFTVHNSLKLGEKVHLMSLNNGKKYYVLDRVV